MGVGAQIFREKQEKKVGIWLGRLVNLAKINYNNDSTSSRIFTYILWFYRNGNKERSSFPSDRAYGDDSAMCFDDVTAYGKS